jgi:superfamily II DNA/RNA helicase
LATQISVVVAALGDHLEVKAYACVGGTRISTDLEALEKGVHIVIGTPGRVLDLLQRKALDPRNIVTLVLDEADECYLEDSKIKFMIFTDIFHKKVKYAYSRLLCLMKPLK